MKDYRRGIKKSSKSEEEKKKEEEPTKYEENDSQQKQKEGVVNDKDTFAGPAANGVANLQLRSFSPSSPVVRSFPT